MDTGKTDGRTEDKEKIDLTNKEEVEKLKREFVGESPEIDFEEARQHNRQVTESIKQSLDKAIKSRWVIGREKEHYKLFRYILIEQGKMAELLVTLAEGFYGLKEALFYNFLDVELTRGSTEKDMGSIKSRMEKLLESPAVQQLEKILKGNEEALRKLDKNRQEVLRDSIV